MNVKSFFCFYILLFLVFFFNFTSFTIAGKYSDWLEYKIENGKIHSTIWIDKFYQSSKSGKDIESLDFSYPSVYNQFNTTLNKSLKNPFVKLYVKYLLRNRVVIYSEFSIKDKKNAPWFLSYLDKFFATSILFLDQKGNMEKLVVEGKNNFINLNCFANKDFIKINSKVYVNQLSFSQKKLTDLSFYDLYISFVFYSFPVNNFIIDLSISRIIYESDRFINVFKDLKMEIKDEKIGINLGKIDVSLLKKESIKIGFQKIYIDLLNFPFFSALKNPTSIFSNFKADIKIGKFMIFNKFLTNIFINADFSSINESVFFVFFRRIIFNYNELYSVFVDKQKIIDNIDNFLGFAHDYQSLIPRLLKDLIKNYRIFHDNLKKGVLNNLFFCFDIKKNRFYLSYNGVYFYFLNNIVSFINKDMIVLGKNISDFVAFNGSELATLYGKEVNFFSNYQLIHANFKEKNHFFLLWTDYINKIIVNKKERYYFYLSFQSFKEKLKFVSGNLKYFNLETYEKIDRFINNLGIDNFEMVGDFDISKNKMNTSFSLLSKNWVLFLNLQDNYGILSKNEKIYQKVWNVLTNSYFSLFSSYKDIAVFLSNKEAFVSIKDKFYYANVDIDKFKHIYELFPIKKDKDFWFYWVLNNHDYVFSLLKNSRILLKDDNLFFFNYKGNMLFSKDNILLSNELLKNFDLLVRSLEPKILHFLIKTNYGVLGFNINFGKKFIAFNSNGILKLSDKIFVVYDIDKKDIKPLMISIYKELKHSKKLDNVFSYFVGSKINILGYIQGNQVLKIGSFDYWNEKGNLDVGFEIFSILQKDQLFRIVKIFNIKLNDKLKNLEFIENIKFLGILKIYENKFKVIIKDASVRLDYGLNKIIFSRADVNFNGSILLSYNKLINAGIFFEVNDVDKVKLGFGKFLFNKDGMEVDLKFGNEFFGFLNRAFDIYFGVQKNSSIDFYLHFKDKKFNGKIKLLANFNEVIFDEYRLKGFNGEISADFKNDKNLVIKNSILETIVENIDKIFLDLFVNVNYYSYSDGLYRTSFQIFNMKLNDNNILLDGNLNFSALNISKLFKNLSTNKEFLKSYFEQVLSTGFFELKFNRAELKELKKNVRYFMSKQNFFIDEKNLSFFNNLIFNFYFVLDEHAYSLTFYPLFQKGLKKNNDLYYLDKLIIDLKEDGNFIGKLGFDYLSREIEFVNIVKIPDYLRRFDFDYTGEFQASLDFKNKDFVLFFNNLAFNYLNNEFFINGKMILKDNVFVPPFVKINGQEVKIGFDGNFVSIISEMKKLNIGMLDYQGNLKVNLLFSPNFKKLSQTENLIKFFGTIEANKGIVKYQKVNYKGNFITPLDINVSIKTNSVRFKNNFIDVFFSGNLRYNNKSLFGSLNSRKGFVSLVDGLYRILQAKLDFNGNFKGDLYAILQRMSSSIFEQKITVLKGNLANLNLEQFGFTDVNKQEYNNRDLRLGIYNTSIFDLISFSFEGYMFQREVFPSIFVSYFKSYNKDNFNRLGYEWYYSIDWLIFRLKYGVLSTSFRSYSNGRNSIGFVFVKGF